MYCESKMLNKMSVSSESWIYLQIPSWVFNISGGGITQNRTYDQIHYW